MPSESTRQLHPRGGRAARWAVVVVAAAVLCAVFPPIRIVRKADAVAASRPSGPLSAADFWEQRLIPSLNNAVEIDKLLGEIRRDPEAARKAHARQLGIGGSYYYFVRGTGRVLSVSPAGSTALAVGDDTDASVLIDTGPLFGNALRDGTGLINVSDYPDSQQFNALSEDLNKLVEERVYPKVREHAAVGKQLQFTGVAEVADESTDLKPLRLVPIAVGVKP